MGLISKDVAKITGLTEEGARIKLTKIMKDSEDYKRKRGEYNQCGLGETYNDNTWGFITRVLGGDPTQLSNLLKEKK